jgi:CPA2 family monovalent cation:H+ antiporter-2
MTDGQVLFALAPVIVLLFLGIATAVASRSLRLSPIVGYIALGFALRASGSGAAFEAQTISLLAQLGVMFLLFDIGLHFSLKHIREQASDIFAFGPIQILFATMALGLVALGFGIALLPALLVGATLALSSTAVVARLISERHQQNCPVGLTATAILIFQDVAAIFLLIIAGSLEHGAAILPASALAVGKAALAFGITVLIAHLMIRPLLALVARTRNDEVFTATALFIALAAGWATGKVGLSLTLGAFLGGVTLAETPYRAVIQSEIKPFRGLLLGFFFVVSGLSLNVAVLGQYWPVVVGIAILLMAIKILTNVGASLIFRWSVPGSTQLGFLLAHGSEFAFVILSLPAARALVGEAQASVLVAAVALTMAVTPTLADAGRSLAGRMRRRTSKKREAELTPRTFTAPVLIVGMGTIGRTLADALVDFGINYHAIERDQRRLQDAVADGYEASFGDSGDVRIWEPLALHARKISVLTAPDIDVLTHTTPVAAANYVDLRRFAVVSDEAKGTPFRNIGMSVIVDRGVPPGVDVARTVLTELGIPATAIEAWVQRARERLTDESPLDAVAA